MTQREAPAAHDDAADVHLKTCPQCGSSEHVEVDAAPSRTRTDWVAECTACGVGWRFSDA